MGPTLLEWDAYSDIYHPSLLIHPGGTALFLACQKGHLEIVMVLLDAGADPSIADNDDQTPVDTALRQGHQSCVKLLQVIWQRLIAGTYIAQFPHRCAIFSTILMGQVLSHH